MTTKFSAPLRHITTASVLGLALAAVPTLLTPAQAAPPRHAPAWGYRAKHDTKRDWNNHRDWRDKDRDRNHDRDWRGNNNWGNNNDWHKRSNSNTWKKWSKTRHYRTAYRTTRDRNGHTHKVAYRIYY